MKVYDRQLTSSVDIPGVIHKADSVILGIYLISSDGSTDLRPVKNSCQRCTISLPYTESTTMRLFDLNLIVLQPWTPWGSSGTNLARHLPAPVCSATENHVGWVGRGLPHGLEFDFQSFSALNKRFSVVPRHVAWYAYYICSWIPEAHGKLQKRVRGIILTEPPTPDSKRCLSSDVLRAESHEAAAAGSRCLDARSASRMIPQLGAVRRQWR